MSHALRRWVSGLLLAGGLAGAAQAEGLAARSSEDPSVAVHEAPATAREVMVHGIGPIADHLEHAAITALAPQGWGPARDLASDWVGLSIDGARLVLTDGRSAQQLARDLHAAKVFEGMGIYAPTMGIIGAVLGLMAVMQNLADPSKLGHGIAAAFTATIYGIGLANLFFLPIAAKLKAIVQHQSHVREMIVDGLIAIAQGENPRRMESRLQSYLH